MKLERKINPIQSVHANHFSLTIGLKTSIRFMQNLLLFILILLTNSSIASFTETHEDYLSRDDIRTIDDLKSTYKEAARKNFLLDLPPYREKWEWIFHTKLKDLLSQKRSGLRYPDVYQNILLFDQRIDLLRDFWFSFSPIEQAFVSQFFA